MERNVLYLAAFFMLIISGCSQPEQDKKVFLVFSYHPDYDWVGEEMDGVVVAFENQAIETKSVYLDTKRHTDKAWMDKVAEETYNAILEYDPDAVIVFDDNACELVAKRFIDTDLPVVFCGMNKFPEDYGFPAKNITGVMELELWKESISFLRELVPGIRKIVMMSDDSPTSHGFLHKIEHAGTLPDDVELFSTNSYPEWQEKVLAAQEDGNALALFSYFTLKEPEESGSVFHDTVLQWTLQNSRIPECAIFDFTVKDGGFCGVIEDGFTQGNLAAEMVLEILKGKSPEDIPVVAPHKGKYYFNKTRAEELEIQVSKNLGEEVFIVE